MQPSSLYSIIAGMQGNAKNRVHGWRIRSKECISASHHPKDMIDAMQPCDTLDDNRSDLKKQAAHLS
jgi:hypothetical protein